MTERTEADAIREISLASAAGQHTSIAANVTTVPVPPGWDLRTIDAEQHMQTPRRSRGTVSVHDAAGFAQAVQQRVGENPDFPPVVYADEEQMSLVAVLDDDYPGEPAWRSYRVQLAVRKRPEWMHWRRADGNLMNQEAFAEHIEDGLAELVTPAPGVMLDIAQTFSASTTGRFKGGHRLADGRRQFIYEEELEASAGDSGTVAVPEIIELAVRPFFGADRFAVTARFRFRLRSGELTLGYKLDRPDDVERAAFAAIVDGAAEALGVTPIAGPAPAATS